MPPRLRAVASGRLTVDDLVDAVARLIDSGGVEAVTMRRLARECGVAVTSIYGYVRTKDELLGLFADRLLGAIDVPDTPNPQGEIAYIFRATYEVLVGHPELVQIVAGQPVPGSAALHLLERVLAALVGLGLDDRQIHTAYQVLASYTTGFVQHQAARQHRTPGLPELIGRARMLAGSPADRASSDGSHDNELRDYEAGLSAVLAGISALATDA
jgi:AcrR family transcriptional regulator